MSQPTTYRFPWPAAPASPIFGMATVRSTGGLCVRSIGGRSVCTASRRGAGLPADPAAAHLGLALAYKMENRPDQARDEVISALEAAPNFKPAQKLLLELSGKE